jgi:DNA-binding MarR family transcriptional regulator
LKRIEGRGHLDRRPNPLDGRSSIVALNEQGRTTHANASRGFFEAMKEVGAGLGDIASVRLVLQRLDGVLRQARAGDRGGLGLLEISHPHDVCVRSSVG